MQINEYELRQTEDKLMILSQKCKHEVEDAYAKDAIKSVAIINEVYDVMSLAEEHVWLLGLNTRLLVVGLFEVSHGTLNRALVFPREIFIRLLLCGATSFVIIHNHPSGNCLPSEDDNQLTQRLSDCGRMLGITLTDHVVIGNGIFSYAERKSLE